MKIKEGKKPTAGITVQTRLRVGDSCTRKGNMAAFKKCAFEFGERIEPWDERMDGPMDYRGNLIEFLACENSC